MQVVPEGYLLQVGGERGHCIEHRIDGVHAAHNPIDRSDDRTFRGHERANVSQVSDYADLEFRLKGIMSE